MASSPTPLGGEARWPAAPAPAVSVVIPTFNHGRFLAGAIDSALAQDFDNVEVIVVDDGSTDGSSAIVSRYGDRVRYLWQENRGLSAARNAGILAARGSFVAFLDADDAWLPAFLSAVMQRLSADPGLAAAHTGFCCIDGSGDSLPQVNLTTVADDRMYERLLDGEYFVPSSVVARRECFERVGLFDEALRASEDWDMWLRVAREFRFAGLAVPLVRYRVHGGNMSADPDVLLRYQRMVVAKHFGEPDGPADGWPRERQRACAAVYRFAAHGYYLRRDPDRSRHCLRRALESNPALCDDVDLYYELGCADRPLGHRTATGQIDLEGNAAFLLSSLAAIFDDPGLPVRLRHRRSGAVGHACLALGLLAYERERLDLARRFMARSLVSGVGAWSDRRAWSTLAKSLLGRRLLRIARSRFASARSRSLLQTKIAPERGDGAKA